MHILLIHQAFASPNDPGGTRHYELCRHLIENGHEVTIVTSDLSYLSGKRAGIRPSLVTEESHGGIRVLRAYTHPALHKSFVWRVVSFLSFMATSVLAAMRVRKVDLVMGTSPPIFQAVSAWFVALVRFKPFLLEIRDLWPEFAIDMGVLRNGVLIAMSRWLERFLYLTADHLLVNSPAYRDYLLGKGLDKEKISFITNGVDITQFDPQEKGERIRKELALDGKFVVTYAGAIGLANDIATLLRAAKDLEGNTGIHFLLVGDGKERKNLESWADRHEVKNATFTGSRPKSEMPEILGASDACVAILQDIPMFRTTYPNKVFDYMASGRPTILAIDGVIRQVIDASKGGVFVPPGNHVALAEAVSSLASDPEEARKMGTAAREYVSKQFNRQDQAKAFLDLVQSLNR